MTLSDRIWLAILIADLAMIVTVFALHPMGV